MKNTSEYSCDNCRCSISKEKHHTGKHLSKTKICITAAILLRLGGICISFIYLNYEIIQKLSSYIEVYQIKGLSHLASHSPTFHPTNSNPSEAWREDEMGYICIVLSDRCLPKRKPLNYFKDFLIRIIIRTTPAFFFFSRSTSLEHIPHPFWQQIGMPQYKHRPDARTTKKVYHESMISKCLLQHLLYAELHSKYFPCIKSVSPQNKAKKQISLSPFYRPGSWGPTWARITQLLTLCSFS